MNYKIGERSRSIWSAKHVRRKMYSDQKREAYKITVSSSHIPILPFGGPNILCDWKYFLKLRELENNISILKSFRHMNLYCFIWWWVFPNHRNNKNDNKALKMRRQYLECIGLGKVLKSRLSSKQVESIKK